LSEVDLAEHARDLAAFGLPPARVPATERGAFGVMRENWDALMLFLACGTQWRHAGLAGEPVGLDYAGVAVVASAHGLALDRALLRKLGDIEAGALDGYAERARRGAGGS
jgi:hypothetical protein